MDIHLVVISILMMYKGMEMNSSQRKCLSYSKHFACIN